MPHNPATTAINTVAGGSVIIGSGTKLTDTAVLSGGYNPTGTITFKLYGPGSGTTPIDTESVTVTGDGTYTTPTGYNLPTTGAVTGSYVFGTIQYRWVPPSADKHMVDGWATLVIARLKGGEWRILHVHSSTARADTT